LGESIRLLGDCLLWAAFFTEVTEEGQIFRLIFSAVKVMYSFWKNGLGCNFRDFFHKLIGSPCLTERHFLWLSRMGVVAQEGQEEGPKKLLHNKRGNK
jgi:hypothetical protein